MFDLKYSAGQNTRTTPQSIGKLTSVMLAFTPARSTQIGGTSSTPGPPVNTGLSLRLLKQLVLNVRLRGL